VKLPKLISRLFRSKPPTDDYWYTPFAPSTSAGVKVSEATAIKYLTVYACVSLIAGDVARLPLILYRRLPGGGKERVTDHPLYDILHTAPNPETTSYHYRESALAHDLLWGNHYAQIERNRLGKIMALWQMPNPGGVEVDRDSRGEIVYKWKDANNVEQTAGRREMFHVPGLSFNGLVGFSMIGIAREAIGMGLAAESFGNRYFGEGTHPSGVMILPPESQITDAETQKRYIAMMKSQYAGLGKSHGMMVLFNGEKYQPLTIPLDDAQFLETRDHQKVEICGMYHVPPHKIALHGQNSNYNNLEQENSSYVDSCLMHWLVRWEQCISHQLLTPEERRGGLFAEFLVDGLLRGDSQARSEFYSRMLQSGAISPNEIREKENLNPVDGGDEYFIQLNMQTLKNARANEEAMQKLNDQPAEPEETPAPEEKSLPLPKSTKKEIRSLAMRDRLVNNYKPLFIQAAQQIVNRESLSVARRVKKEQRSDESLLEWLTDFYNEMPAFIRSKIEPVMRSYGQAVYAAAADEAGLEPNDPDIAKFVENYIDGYAARHVGSSRGQLLQLLNDGSPEDLVVRVDEWHETRAEKIANNETARQSNAVYQATAFAIGLSTVWRIRGPKTCPYCQTLNGRRVSSGQYFAMPGDRIRVEGQDDMLVRGLTAHPPIHRGCDCYLAMI